MSDKEHSNRGAKAFSVVLYVFSGLALALGALLFFLLLGAASAVPGYDIFFQLAGIEQLAQVVLRPLQAGLINIAVVVLFLMLAIAGLLFAAGRLAASQASLALRVRALEEKLERVSPQS